MSNCYLTPSQIKLRRKNISIMVILIVLIFITFIISMNTGVIKLTPLDIFWTLLGQGDAQQQVILFEFRLPRIVIAVFVGMGLAISGAILQGVSKNALADPGILGINAGAGLAVMLYVSFFPITKAAPVYLLPVLAFIGAGLTAVIIYTLSYRRHEGITPMRLILTGVAVAAGISSAMIVLTLRLSPENYQFVATWLAGSIWGSNWLFVFSLLPWLVILLPFVFVKATVLNVLNLGELTAVGLGASIEKERRWLLVAAVGLAGASVSVSGGIGFVGLIAPHLARQLVGAKHQFLLPTAALLGGFLVLMADTVGRSIFEPSEIPTGIVVAVIGAPYFLYLLARLKE
ncbi:iron ABC transporter permease [Lysinibacillus irui]|uniref:Iron ABC transporter permease n=1 Tax=Lysinibacillus irui TaxID=2998077 RepID=A0ABU5NGB5_9BACI|nr:iron ABC transporter permease [Lysinibacillus irui]MEA0553970.1 iron ABC transporter permease [Lysinibacillus irui]MEA0975088.1 iron ABC transporter permease [Lysinibacillus irui]MEA1041242.1 iron ABC transporter permease [Lysinibacillus irui]